MVVFDGSFCFCVLEGCFVKMPPSKNWLMVVVFLEKWGVFGKVVCFYRGAEGGGLGMRSVSFGFASGIS